MDSIVTTSPAQIAGALMLPGLPSWLVNNAVSPDLAPHVRIASGITNLAAVGLQVRKPAE